MRRWPTLLVVGVLFAAAGCAADESTAPEASSPATETEPSTPPTTSASEQAAPSPTQPSPVADRWTLTTDGFGPIEIGKSVPEEVRDAFDAGWECFGPTMVHPKHGGIEIWSQDGTVDTTVTALNLADHNAIIDTGAWVGMSNDELQRLLPDLAEVSDADPAAEVVVYRNAADDNDAVSIFYEVEDESNSVVGISAQPHEEYQPVSNRVCGGS